MVMKEARVIDKQTSIILVVSGLSLAYMSWFMVPEQIIMKKLIFLVIAIFLVILPILLTTKLIERFPALSTKNASIISIILLLSLPAFFNATYISKRDAVLRSIPANNRINIDISIESNMISNNSVGNEWFTDIKINGRELDSDESFTTTSVSVNSTLRIDAQVTESDNIPDRGRGSIEIDLKNLDYSKENSFTIPITVRENRGRYSGNTAKWEIVCSIKRNLSFWQVVMW